MSGTIPHYDRYFRIFFLPLILLSFILNPVQATDRIIKGSDSFEEMVRNQSEIVSLTEQQHQQVPSLKSHEPGTAMEAGYGISLELSANNSGFLEKSGDSLLIWKVMIETRGSISMGLVLENFSLSDQSELLIYTPDETLIAGPYTSEYNNEYQMISTPVFPTEQLIVQYTEPMEDSVENEKLKIRHSHFYISEVIHIFQGGLHAHDKNLGSSGSCQVNINCSEGDPWQRQKRGVARILMRTEDDENEEISYSWCSGTLISVSKKNHDFICA